MGKIEMYVCTILYVYVYACIPREQNKHETSMCMHRLS
jgi:hypothetical protein